MIKSNGGWYLFNVIATIVVFNAWPGFREKLRNYSEFYNALEHIITTTIYSFSAT